MIDARNISYDVIVITENNLQLNITQAVEELGWEENEDELAMKITFEMYNALYNSKRLSTLVKHGSVIAIKAHWGSGEGLVALGTIFECTCKTSKSDEIFDIVAYDNLFYFQKSNDCFYFEKGKKTQSIITAILESWGITLSKYNGPNVSHSRILEKNKRISDILLDVIDEAKKKGGVSAILRSTEGKIEVVKKGSNSTIYAFTVDNSTEASYKTSTTELVTRVKVISSEDSDSAAKVEATVDGKTQYGYFQKIVTKSKSDDISEAKKEANEIIDEKGSPKETIRFIGPDIPPIRKGDLVHIENGVLNGFYIAKSVQHNAKSARITMELEKYVPEAEVVEETSSAKSYSVGDVVYFKGGTHYISSYAGARGYSARAGNARITLGPDCKANGGAHPWHLIHTDSTSNVYGWVDEGTFE